MDSRKATVPHCIRVVIPSGRQDINHMYCVVEDDDFTAIQQVPKTFFLLSYFSDLSQPDN